MSSKADGPFFGPGALRFLRELRRNNNRPWFQANKARYEEAVQRPAVRFIEAMGPRLARISPSLVADPRPFGGSLRRIYRDTRFSKDKSPYRTSVGIHFSHRDGSDADHLPGYFLHLGPGDCALMSGIWRPQPLALRKIRDAIVARPAEWKAARGGGIQLWGELYARVPSGYDTAHPLAEDLRRKDFVGMLPVTDAEVAGPRFGAWFERSCRRMAPLNALLAAAVGAPW